MSRVARIVFSLFVMLSIAGISGVATSAQEPTPSGLSVDDLIQMSSQGTSGDRLSTAEEFSVTETLNGVEVIEYVQNPTILGHIFNSFSIKAGISWCSVNMAPWVIIDKAHVILNDIDEGDWVCGMVPDNWATNILISYPDHVFFSSSDASLLMAAIGQHDAYRFV